MKEDTRRVAIFGANGYLGKHLTHYLEAEGVICELFDLQDKATIQNEIYTQCDVQSKEFWESFLAERYDGIYFFAGLTGPEKSFNNAELFVDVNEKGLMHLLMKLVPLGTSAPKVFFPSSRLVYQGGETVTETSELLARSVYAANKIACESLLTAYHCRFGIPYVILRICVPYGNYIDKTYAYGTVGFFVKQAKAGKDITVYGDGHNSKTYTHIWDVCEIFRRLLDARETAGIFNVGGVDYTLQEVAQMIADIYHVSVSHIPWPEAAAAVEMGNISLNAEKLATSTGFSVYRRMEDNLHDL